MANSKIIERKAGIVSKIKEKFENAKSVVLFDYRGLTVSEVTELRKKLREVGSDYKVYKNTMTARAFDELKVDLNDYLTGPNAITFGSDELSIVKILSDFAKEHDKLELKAGVIDGKVAGLEDTDITATVLAMEAIGKQFNVNIVISASIEEAALSDALKDKVVVAC